MNIVRELGAKGQIVVPKDIREYFGLKKGSKVVFEVKSDEIIIRPQKDEEFVEIFCSIVKKKLTKKFDVKELYYEQIEKRDLL
jgi:AbrB family looped-hinge helix DNA binding protein